MSLTAEPSLQIGFDVTRTAAVLRAAAGFQSELAKLSLRFGNGSMRGPVSAEIPLDDFLASLEELGSWPAPESVQWEEALAELAGSVLDDADLAQKQLSGAAPEQPAVDPDNVLGLLGGNWEAGLTSFQQRDVARLLSLRHGANFSVPGAGKTRTTMAVFAALREQREVSRLLVVSPKSAYEAWQTEAVLCFRQAPRTTVMAGSPDPGAEILIVNYERLDRQLAALAGWLKAGPSMLVLDEAHRMKLGSQGIYGAACMALGPLSKRRLILTGTPAPNGARDLENLLSFVWPGHGRRVVNRAVAGGDLAHASAVLRPLYTRTTKRELGLPPALTTIRYVDMPALHREIYDALAGQYSARAEAARSDFEALGKSMLRMLMAATSPALLNQGNSPYEPLEYRLDSQEVPENASLQALLANLPSYELSPKYQEARHLVAENAAKGRKTLVWASFVRSLTTLELMLKDFRPAVVHGGTADRDEQIRRFREDPDCAVLISNPATLGEGISLHQVCHDAVYVDRDFQAGRFLQSLDRIHRLGLPPGTETRITVLACRGTVDETVAKRLELKLQFMGRILDDPAVQQLADLQEEPAIAAGMNMADIQAFLEHLDAAAAR
ncbi:DEAD/DEAH box helicase [Kitasatospora sp. RG8]|uniref:DEAD/DEAH box helicase n=1 Tax=Kitasatospora sp. RG8 TaxID=2820815 RepID=UPI0027DCBEBB|nr:DEAD/DEAH box helicase [Kitasatospora sp. RG8]